MKTLISLKDITVCTAAGQIFEHTHWTILEGQHWAIIGPTGSGKTTLARVLCRQVAISEGEVLFYFDTENPLKPQLFPGPGEILTLSAETHQHFMQRYAGYHQARWQSFEGDEVSTVSELLSPIGQDPIGEEDSSKGRMDLFSTSDDRDLFLGPFKLDNLMNRKLNQLSIGESRKVFLVSLLLQSPRLLILDDPFNGLDQASREALSHEIEKLLENRRPQILLISSRFDDLSHAIDHLLVLNDNHIIAQGEKEAVIQRTDVKPILSTLSGRLGKLQNSAEFMKQVERYSKTLENNIVSKEHTFIEMDRIYVKYENVQILKDIHWTVRQGERWALMGHNGAGKTTLLSLILADNPQSYANEMTLFGKKRGSGESIWEIKHNIGWVSSELQIFYQERISCLEMICSGFFDSVGLYYPCSPKQIEIAKGWGHALGLEDLADKPYQSLSTGQKRLALLARALVKDPPLLVLDEPCQSLDGFHRQYIIELLNQLCTHTSITMIYVTHYQDEIPASMTHILELKQGEVIRKGIYDTSFSHAPKL